VSQADNAARLAEAREQRILDIFHDRHGTIDGVEIDFRHKELGISAWFPPPFNNRPVRPPSAPFIWFPWFGDYDKDAVREEVQRAATRGPKRTPPSARSKNQKSVPGGGSKSVQPTQLVEEEIARLMAERKPDCFVYPGDRVCVARVAPQRVGTALDCEQDGELRKVYLCIHRAGGGKIDEIPIPMIYKGFKSVLDDDLGVLNFVTMEDRILAHFQLSRIQDAYSVPNDGSYAYKALRKAYAVERSNNGPSFKSIETITVRLPNEEIHDGSNIWYTIVDALMMGFYWAKQEVPEADRLQAEAKQKKKLNSRNRGDRSADARKTTQAEWHVIAGKVIEKLWTTKPKASRAAALRYFDDKKWNEVKLKFRLPDLLLPSDSSLRNFIREFYKRRNSTNDHGSIG
jgi:hypothetical protein